MQLDQMRSCAVLAVDDSMDWAAGASHGTPPGICSAGHSSGGEDTWSGTGWDAGPPPDASGAVGEQVAAVDLAALAAAGNLGEAAPDPQAGSLRLIACAEIHRVCGMDGAVTPSGDMCHVCRRVSQDTRRHRLGLHWRILGYRGPPYCQRCASVFRAHLIRQSVSSDCCSRQQPCRICSTLLPHFAQGVTQLYRNIDEKTQESEAQKQSPLTATTRICGEDATVDCPHCALRVSKSDMGTLW